METVRPNDDVETNFLNLLELEPKLITSTVPANAQEEKKHFISGEHPTPEHVYPKLNIPDDKLVAIEAAGKQILAHSEFDTKHEPVYRAFIDGYLKKTRLMQYMYDIKTAETEEDKLAAKHNFMELNAELYGLPVRTTYVSLLQEKLAAIDKKNLSESAKTIQDELLDLIPDEYANQSEKVERFKPSPETIQWIKDAVESLYGSMLTHIPEKDTFDVHELRDIFESILRTEFEDAAADWRVDIEQAKSINIKAAEKRIVIPEDRGELSYDLVRKLVVHELGVHVLRAINGGQTDVGPLRTGLNEYYDSEEGLGKVMEQALSGEFVEAGVDHYITAGAAYFDHKNFRETFELKWRLGVLEKATDGEEVTEAMIDTAKNAAYGGVMRIFRGTDELPWFKDLAYYNGTAETWKFLEKIRGDDFRLTLLLMGKMNTSDEHLRTILESKTA